MRVDFMPTAWNDYTYWQTQDKKTLKRINQLIESIVRNGYKSIGNSEPLKGNLTGWWSCRIDEKNRLVYKINDNAIEILSCRGHYEDK
jgi:toxin YoeB